MSSMLFCDDLAEAIRMEDEAKRRAGELLQEMPLYIRTPGVLGIEIRRVLHNFSGWAVEARLTYDGETVREYDSFELLELDLLHLQMTSLLRRRQKE